jgi:hypothetical protein
LSTDTNAWWDAVHIKDAFRELSEKTFNVWIVLHTLTSAELSAGVKKLGPRLNMHPRRFSTTLRKLAEIGYVAINRGPNNFHPIKITLIKRASVKPSSHFVLVGAGRGRTKLTADEEDEKIKKFGSEMQKAKRLALPTAEKRKIEDAKARMEHRNYIAAKRERRRAARLKKTEAENASSKREKIRKSAKS